MAHERHAAAAARLARAIEAAEGKPRLCADVARALDKLADVIEAAGDRRSLHMEAQATTKGRVISHTLTRTE